MMTDERQGTGVIDAVRSLPANSGIVFRHYSLAENDRRALFDEVAAAAQPRGVTILLAGTPTLAEAWGADGWHGWAAGTGLHSASVHNLRELRRAEETGPLPLVRHHPHARQ